MSEKIIVRIAELGQVIKSVELDSGKTVQDAFNEVGATFTNATHRILVNGIEISTDSILTAPNQNIIIIKHDKPPAAEPVLKVIHPPEDKAAVATVTGGEEITPIDTKIEVPKEVSVVSPSVPTAPAPPAPPVVKEEKDEEKKKEESSNDVFIRLWTKAHVKYCIKKTMVSYEKEKVDTTEILYNAMSSTNKNKIYTFVTIFGGCVVVRGGDIDSWEIIQPDNDDEE